MKLGQIFAVISAAGLMLFGSQAVAGITFAPAVDYATGSSMGPGPAPETTVGVDVDNDGDIDVILADLAGNGPLLMRNNGDATFSAPERIGTPTPVGAVNAADHNGDGNVDLLAANGFQVFVLQGDGSGGFSQVQTLDLFVGGQQQAIALDVTSDGIPDIVGVTQGGLQIHVGNGDGTFGAGQLNMVPGLITAIAVANLNNDGHVDLVASDAFGQRALALLGDGNGGFSQSGFSFVGFIPEDITAGDLNNDGIDDVVTADSFSFTITSILSNGQGGFGSTHRYYAGVGPVSAALADFDGDGNLDLAEAVVGEAKVNVFAGNGDGSFASPQAVSVTGFPQTPMLADLDNDGDIDMAVAGPQNLSIVKNLSQ